MDRVVATVEHQIACRPRSRPHLVFVSASKTSPGVGLAREPARARRAEG